MFVRLFETAYPSSRCLSCLSMRGEASLAQSPPFALATQISKVAGTEGGGGSLQSASHVAPLKLWHLRRLHAIADGCRR